MSEPESESVILRVSRRGTVRFGTSKIVDLSGGELPCVVVRVNVDQRTGVAEDDDRFNVRTEKQRARRVRECQQGWRFGWDSHVEIRKPAETTELR